MIIQKSRSLRIMALFFAIMASGGTLLIPREVWVVFTLIAALMALRWKVSLRSNETYIYVWIAAVTLLQLALGGADELMSVASRLTTSLAAFFLLKAYLSQGLDAFQRDAFDVLKPLAIIAIATSILGNVVPNSFSPLAVGDLVYYHLGYILNFHYVHNVVTPLIRPNAVFYEPGVLQIYLTIFMYLAFFWRNSIFWSAISLISLLTTISTIGILNAVFLLCFGLVNLSQKLRGKKLILMITLIVTALPGTYVLLSSNINEKFYGADRGSAIARQYDLATGINIIREHPITGIGFSTDAYQNQSAALGYKNTELAFEHAVERANSNGIVQIFFSIGIPLALPLLIGMFRQRLFQRRIVLGFILFTSLLGQSLAFSVFFLFIFFSGMLVKLQPVSRSQRIIS